MNISVKTLIILIAVIIIPACSSTPSPEEYRAEYNKFLAKQKSKPNLKEAEAYFDRGVEKYGKGDLDDAIADYTKAIEINPKFVEAYYNRGLAHRDKGEVNQAIADYSKVIELNPKYADAYAHRSIAYNTNMNYKGAIADGEMWLKLVPEHPKAQTMRSVIEDWKKLCLALESAADLLKTTEKDIELNPNDHRAWSLKSVALMALGRNEEARKAYDKANELESLEEAPKARDELIAQNPNCKAIDPESYKEGLKAFDEIVALIPNDADAYYYRGSIYEFGGDIESAIADYTKAIELNPKYAKAYFNRAKAYIMKREINEAIKDLAKAAELDPDKFDSSSIRGFADSLSSCTEAIKKNPQDAVAYYDRGFVCDRNDYSDTAILDYSEAIRLDPKYTYAYYNLGIIYHNKSDFDKAIFNFNKAIESNPEFARAYFSRSDSYAAKGDFKSAIADGKEFLDIDPEHPLAKDMKERLKEWKNKLKQ